MGFVLITFLMSYIFQCMISESLVVGSQDLLVITCLTKPGRRRGTNTSMRLSTTPPLIGKSSVNVYTYINLKSWQLQQSPRLLFGIRRGAYRSAQPLSCVSQGETVRCGARRFGICIDFSKADRDSFKPKVLS